jgi:Mor family transcriptional regulator
VIQIGGKIKPEDLNGVYQDIAEAFDVEMAYKFHEHFNGLQLTFPTRLLAKEYVLRQIEIEFDGCNLQELSRKYGYSERWLRSLIKEYKEGGKSNE